MHHHETIAAKNPRSRNIPQLFSPCLRHHETVAAKNPTSKTQGNKNGLDLKKVGALKRAKFASKRI
ncbi:hypothetical protein Lser_V15G39997 [Lactuca serriola]